MLLGIVYGVLLLKNGSSFESFVSYVYSKLLSLNGYNEVVVSKNVKIKDSDDDRPTIPLLFSKVLAQNLLDMQMEKDDWCVRGISQYQLEVLLNMHKLGNIQFALFPAVWNDSTLHCVIAEAHIVKELYLRK